MGWPAPPIFISGGAPQGHEVCQLTLRLMTEGACEGRIGWAPRGSGGFGYDPLFILEGDGRTMAELSPDDKNRLSHRARALHKMAEALAARYGKIQEL